MASKNPDVSRAVINLANACKNPTDKVGIADARAALAAVKVADFIERTLAEAPSLTKDQRGRLVRLLRADGGES